MKCTLIFTPLLYLHIFPHPNTVLYMPFESYFFSKSGSCPKKVTCDSPPQRV